MMKGKMSNTETPQTQGHGQAGFGSELSRCKTEGELVEAAGLEYGIDSEQVACIKCPLCYSGGKEGRFKKGQQLFTLRQSISEHLQGDQHTKVVRARMEEESAMARGRHTCLVPWAACPVEPDKGKIIQGL